METELRFAGKELTGETGGFLFRHVKSKACSAHRGRLTVSNQLLEEVLRGAALRTNPVIGQFLERSPGFDAIVGVALLRLIDVAAHRAFPSTHRPFSLMDTLFWTQANADSPLSKK
jgi:hypothetical protein